jgi:CheY-like chemotaxis protein
MNPELASGLETAPWPVLLVAADASVLSANAAAKLFFGDQCGKDSSLDAVWPAENGCAAADFFVLWETHPLVCADLKFRAADGSLKSFSTVITADGDKKNYLLQLFSPAESPLPAQKFSPDGKPAPLPTGDTVLRRRLDVVMQLSRSVSLDMNNALTGVLAHTSRLLDQAEPGHPWRAALLEVEKSAARAAEITAELAVFSQREKKERRQPAPGNLNLIVSRCVDFFRNAHARLFDWRLVQEPALFGARFDEAKLQQALTKILENAVDSFPTNRGGLVTVETSNVELSAPSQDRNVSLAAGHYVCVGVSDTGAGMGDDILARAFEPFFTTKAAPHRGLGLALVYGIVTNHGGGVALSSVPGQGTSVRIYLPAEKNFVHAAIGADKDLRGTETILVVDDEALVLTMAETILSDYGYKVLTASSGTAALALLARRGVATDLVLTDLVMPGLGGRELAERIRAAGRLPVIFMSGYVMPSGSPDGADYLQKPFTSRQLLSKVRAALRVR